MPLRKDITGNRYGALKCLRYHGRDNNYQSLYLCSCDCGEQTIVRRQDLVSGKTKSCGCGQGKFTHGLSRTNGKKHKLYAIWVSMRDRCNNENNSAFHRYGGRGITVCKKWDDYVIFHSWALANGYQEGLTIERKDNNGNYEPENCTWIPRNLQQFNTGKITYLELDGETHSITEWSSITGIKKDTIRGRLRLGLDVRTALTKEVKT